MFLPVDGEGLPQAAGRRGDAVAIRFGGGSPAAQQRGGACPSPRGDLAEDELRDGFGGGEPFRRADAYGGGDLPATWGEALEEEKLLADVKSIRERLRQNGLFF